ncbi:hypothetical protein TWF481_008819 [Arthrobotrys musiformis]|uniref:Methyltransferase type 11 domain-containing protein n=1 Tax=Arthrobotrys musiformis TaxID=47236 RepID=A0AAV9W8F3_9PEZI
MYTSRSTFVFRNRRFQVRQRRRGIATATPQQLQKPSPVVPRLHKTPAGAAPNPRKPGNSFPAEYSHITRYSFDFSTVTNAKMAASTSTSVHPVADAFSTSGSSGLYEKARPSYPPESLSKIFTAFHKSAGNGNDRAGINIVELGAGTGIFTRLLISPPETTPQLPQINKIVAVEPGPGMREGFISALTSKNIPVGTAGTSGAEKVQILHGAFDSIPVEDGWADGVVIAQAFHWAHGHYANALKEIARVLKPGAPLVLIWNLEDRRIPDFHPWVAKIRDIYEQYEKGTPQYRLGWWKVIFELPEYKELYEEKYEEYETVRTLSATVDAVVERILSKSYITALDEEEKVKVEKSVREILETERKQWDDEGKGVFKYPYATDVYVIWRK